MLCGRANPPWPSLATFDNWRLTGFALFTSRLPEAELERFGRRLQFSRANLNHLHNARAAIALLPDLSRDLPPSEVVRLLEPLDEVGWLAAWAAAPNGLARQQITRFAREWRFVKPTLGGSDLKAITGIKPGPIYGRLLGRLRAAWLDGAISSPEEEKALLRRLLDEQASEND
jgi:hypothetical protein